MTMNRNVKQDKKNEKILYQAVLETPRGRMTALATHKGLAALEFMQPHRQHLLEKRIKKYFAGYQIQPGRNTVIQQTEQWLTHYFQKQFHSLQPPPLDMRGTDFELKVWRHLQTIPCGSTRTYGQMAAALGNPNCSRAIGGANGRNPVSLIVPCHRVIGSNQALVGYGGGLDIKEALLDMEGVG